MHKCSKCGTEYEGNFCPECGAKWEEAKTCPKCGKALERGVKFCPGCGYSFVPASATSSKPASAASPVTVKTVKRYTSIAVFPAVLFVLLSVIFMLLFLAPVAVMPGGELLGQKIPSESYGNVYEISNYADTSLTGSLTMLIVFAACALFLAALIVFTAPFIKARYKRVMIFGKRIFLRNVFAGIGYVLFFLLFLISCILLGQISNEDGGFGIFTAGAAPILIIVFALIGCLVALIFALIARHMRQTYPVLVRVQERIIATAEPTGFEIWVKKHKVVTAILSVVVVAAVIVGVSFSFIGATRNNGVYYAYNGATEQYNMQQYYKISGNSWQDNDGNKGEIIFDGENVTLIYDASGGMDKTGSSKIELKGTLVNDVLNLNGVVYATGGHKHEYGNWHAGDAGTCVQKATEAHDCACGRRETREIDQFGDHVYVNGKEATCAEHGVEGEYCSLCGQLSSSAKVIPALHVEYDWSTSGQYLYVSGLSEECDHREITIPQYYPYGNKLYPVKSISGFKNHTALTSITLPDGVTSIGDEAFLGCTSLTSITIPDSVTSIGANAFSGTAYYDNDKNWDNSGVLYIGNHLIAAKNTVSGSYTIRTGTKTISGRAFYGCNGLTSIAIPDSVSEIGDRAFYNCSGLTNITIPDSVTTIGDHAFSNCSGLKDITIPDNVTSIGESAFSGCGLLTSVNWNAKMCTEAGSDSNPIFSDCTKLTMVTFGKNTNTIPAYAFKGCSGLGGITIPGGVTEIGESAFKGCTGLASVVWNAVKCTEAGSYSHPIFSDCTKLETVIFAEYVKIPAYAFKDCTGLMNIYTPSSVTRSVTEIGESAFEGCSRLTNITIPDSVTSIGDSAFKDCTGLASVVWNAVKCTEAGSDSNPIFSDCTKLTMVTFGKNTNTIPAYAFKGCSGLSVITIPDNVTKIGGYVFEDCSGLTSVTIGSGVTSIGFSAFFPCDGLEKFTVTEGNKTYCSVDGVLYDHAKTRILQVPKAIKNTVTIPDSVSEIGEQAFQGCNRLTSITIPDSVTSIGYEAFSGCSSLTSVTIGNGVTSIGYGAFYGCSGLTDIQFKGTVEEWRAIEKRSYWDSETGYYTITCTDGTIDTEGNVTYFEQ